MDSGGGSKSSGEEVRCYKCRGLGDYASDCKKGEVCFKWAKQVTGLMSARVRRLFATTVRRLDILVPSVLNQRRNVERSLH